MLADVTGTADHVLRNRAVWDQWASSDAASIRAGLEEAGGFLPFVFGADPAARRGEQMRTAMRRYTAMLAREHRADE